MREGERGREREREKLTKIERNGERKAVFTKLRIINEDMVNARP